MSYLLEILGKGIASPLLSLILPRAEALTRQQAKMLIESLEDDPSHRANQLRLGIHWAQSGAVQQAETVFDKLTTEDPSYTEAWLAWAAMHAAQGQIEQTMKLAQKARQANPQDSRAWFFLGYANEHKEQPEQALKAYQEGTAHSPYLRSLRQRMAALYFHQGNTPACIDQYLALQKEHPEEVWNYMAMGHLFMDAHDYRQAEAHFERALTIEPDNFEKQDEQVEKLRQQGRVNDAIERMEEKIDDQGQFPDMHVQLADLYSQIGDDSKALQHYHQALEIHPGYLEGAVKLGTQHLRMARYYEAAGQFNQAIEINDKMIAAYVGLGLTQKRLKKLDTARDTLELACTLEPNTNLLFAEVNRLQIKAAQMRQTHTHPYDPMQTDLMEDDFADPHETKIMDQDQLLDYQLSRYQKKLKQNPYQALLHYHYALLLRGKGHHTQAMEHFRNAININPSFSKARIKLGLGLWEKGQYEQAENELYKAYQTEPEYIDLHYHLGLMYCDKIKFALAVEYYDWALVGQMQSKEDIEANILLALQNMALVDRAQATWRSVCEIDPQSPLAFQAQRCLTELNPNRL